MLYLVQCPLGHSARLGMKLKAEPCSLESGRDRVMTQTCPGRAQSLTLVFYFYFFSLPQVRLTSQQLEV